MKRLIPLVLTLGVFLPSAASAADWSFWRGPEQNGISRDKDLPDKFDGNVLWSAPVGGITTPIVQNGRIYFITRTGDKVTEQERVVCLNEKDGSLVWEHKFNVFYADIVSDRLGWSTMVGDPETGNVYAHGVQGLLFCFDKDGKVLWEHSLTEEYGRVSGYGGRVTSPIIDGDLLILGMMNSSWGDQGSGRTRFVAFDKKTGGVVWWGSGGHPPKNTYYSIPVVAVIGGQRLVISGGGDGCVHAFKVRTGEKVWTYKIGNEDVNCSPVVSGDLVYIGHGETNDDSPRQGRVVCLDGSEVKDGKPKLVWQKFGIKVKFASPVLDKDRLYVCNEVGKLYCLDAKDGTVKWTHDYAKNTKGSPLLADGKIYIGGVDGEFQILQPGDKECKVLDNHVFEDSQVKGSAIAVNGKVYFMTTDKMYCLGKKDHSAKSGAILPEPMEAPVAKDAKPAHLQILPADVVLMPGESASFTVRAFDDKGRLIGESKGEWSLAGQLLPEGVPPPPPGTPPPPALKAKLSEANGKATKLTIDAVPAIQAGRLLVKQGELTGEARVRVVPKLPFAADFSKVPEGRTPSGWVNCQGRFAVVKDGDKVVLKKLANNGNELLARAYSYLGAPNLADYTISADVKSAKAGEDMTDVGIVASRYRLELVGNTQTLRLTSWDALPRIDKTIAFKFDEKKWYSMKLTTEAKGDKVIVRGKVWTRDTPEPKEWTVEVTDPVPNREGAPALYAYAKGIKGDTVGAEAWFDNVKVVPNKGADPKGEKPESKPAKGEQSSALSVAICPPVEFTDCVPPRVGPLRRLFR
jgi:outer membrane protein assembly factor BamB